MWEGSPNVTLHTQRQSRSRVMDIGHCPSVRWLPSTEREKAREKESSHAGSDWMDADLGFFV